MTGADGAKRQPESESTAEANETLNKERNDQPREPQTGKVFAGQRAEYALNPLEDEEAGPDAESETEKEAEEAVEDRRETDT